MIPSLGDTAEFQPAATTEEILQREMHNNFLHWSFGWSDIMHIFMPCRVKIMPVTYLCKEIIEKT